MSVDAGHLSQGHQDAFDLRDEIIMQGNHQDDSLLYDSHDAQVEDRSVLEDEDEEEDDASSTLSIPNESIDFDLVYSFHTFVATVEGQANVMKGDSLFLMDDSNSYWWLVRVLKTGQIGYIPAENIETPFERLARLNKHRNIDLAAATPAEQQEDVRQSRERVRSVLAARNFNGGHHSPSSSHKSVIFTGSSVYYYPPFVWGNPSRAIGEDPSRGIGEDGDELWDEDEYGSEESREDVDEVTETIHGMEPDDGMSWEDDAVVQAQAQVHQINPVHLGTVGAPSHHNGSGSLLGAVDVAVDTSHHLSTDFQAPILRAQISREKLTNQLAPSPASSSKEILDPAEISETKRLTVTPSIAREGELLRNTSSVIQRSFSISSVASGASSQDSSSSKRQREDNMDADGSDSRRSRTKGPDKKLRKDRSVSGDSRDSQDSADPTPPSGEKERKEKKKGGFMSLFSSKKKDKKDRDTKPSTSGVDTLGRSSTDSITVTPTENRDDLTRQEPSSRRTESPVSIHAARLQQKDQEQQQLYQQYLRKSPTDTPDGPYASETPSAPLGATLVSPANQSAAGALLSPTQRTSRPGSLILTSSTLEGSSAVPTLSVLRVFAGDNLQSDATFKTVLVNASTTSAELVRQGIQRFRLPHGENPEDYYLSIKQLEGSEAVLESDENPLLAFEQLVERALSIPTVKRSSVGSISSLASNLSMHPAIAKLGMNDFTDDSAVKLYLHRRTGLSRESPNMEPTTTSFVNDESSGSVSGNRLSITTSEGPGAVSLERFNSPSTRFSLQVIIYPDDLPDGMVFDPHTEAIIPKSSLQRRSSSSSGPSPGVSQTHRKKIFVFPKNTTVAEVIEASLERFGIVEGVVEGGDDVEDKPAKRRSSSRVRYGLSVTYSDMQPRELQPSSKVLDAFSQPPIFKFVDRRSAELRRRSGDAMQILGTVDDIQSNDPTFVLHKSLGIKSTSGIRSKGSNHLDELALHQRYRDSTGESGLVHLSRRDSEHPIAQSDDVIVRQNADRGLDVIVREKGVVKSGRQGSSIRYGFIPPSGESYDIRSLLEEEWRALGDNAEAYPKLGPNDDILDALCRKPSQVLRQTLGRIMSRAQPSTLAVPSRNLTDEDLSPSVYSDTGTPVVSPIRGEVEITPSRGAYAGQAVSANEIIRDVASTGSVQAGPDSMLPPDATHTQHSHRIHPSISSIDSDISQYTSGSDTQGEVQIENTVRLEVQQAMDVNQDSGLSRMLATIELEADLSRPPPPPPVPMIDKYFLGIPLSLDTLHPAARDFFEPSFRRLDDAEKRLSSLLQMAQAIGS